MNDTLQALVGGVGGLVLATVGVVTFWWIQSLVERRRPTQSSEIIRLAAMGALPEPPLQLIQPWPEAETLVILPSVGSPRDAALLAEHATFGGMIAEW